MYLHLATPCARRGPSDKDTKIVYKRSNRSIWVLIDGTEKKQSFISYSNVSRARIYGKLRIKTDTRPLTQY